jgi:hypothetical protein
MDVEGSVISAAAGIVIHVLLALLFLFATVANVLVIVIFYRRPALRTLSNRSELIGCLFLKHKIFHPAFSFHQTFGF